MAQRQKVGVSGLLIIDGKALVVRRSDKEEYYAGFFELPGGGVEFGEHPNDTMIREFQEETDILVSVLKPFDVFMYIDGDRQVIEVLYLLRAVGDVTVVLSEEHDDYRWVSLEELDTVNLTSEMKENIKKGFSV